MNELAKFGYTILEEWLMPGRPYRLVKIASVSDGQKFLAKISGIREDSLTRIKAEYQFLLKHKNPLTIRPAQWEQDREEAWAIYELPASKFSLLGQQFISAKLEWKLELAITILEALVELHKSGFVHLALDPWTIAVSENGQKVVFVESYHLMPRIRKEVRDLPWRDPDPGHWSFMAPEQSGFGFRQPDQRSDLYSLGLVFYHLFGGEIPLFQKGRDDCAHWHLTVNPPSLRDCIADFPIYLSEIIRHLCQKEMEARYQTAWGALQDLRESLFSLRASGPDQMLAIGQRDVPDDLRFTDAMYGREVETAELESLFQRFVSGESVSLLLTGRSGIGKSRLLDVLRKLSQQSEVLIARGSASADSGARPFAPIMEALEQIIQHILQRPQRELLLWRKQIYDCVGENVALIMKLCPDLGLIMGSYEELPHLPPREEKIRFDMTMRSFIRAFCQKDHPLILVIEQAQLLDPGSVAMLDSIFKSEKLEYLFLIMTFSTDSKHQILSFADVSELMQIGFVHCQTMQLGPLSANNITRLLSELFWSEQEKVETLAHIIFQKTGGIPLFIRNMIMHLHQQGAIAFDFRRFCYFWNLTIAQQSPIAETMVDHVRLIIQKMFEGDAYLLGIAAAFGREFTLPELEAISGSEKVALGNFLERAMELGLLYYVHAKEGVDNREGSYRFTQESIRDVATGALPVQTLRTIHRAIAEHLLLSAAEQGHQERVFSIIDHFNQSVDPKNVPTDLRLAEMNLGAARKARVSASFARSINYLEKAREFLGPDCWQLYYRQTQAVFEEMAICAFLNKDRDLLQEVLEIALMRIDDPLESLVFHEMKIADLMSRDLMAALDYASPVLKKFGLNFPANPTKFRVILELLKTLGYMYSHRYMRRLESAGMSYNSLSAAALKIGTRIGSAAYLVRPNLMPILTAKGVVLGLKHGHVSSVPFAYAGFSVIMLSVFGLYREAFRLARFAEALAKKFDDKQQQCRVDHLLQAFIYPWMEPLRHSLIGLLKTFRRGVEFGEYEFAIHAINLYCHYSFYAGNSILRLEEETAEYRKLVGDLHHEYLNIHTEMARQTFLNLSREDGETVFFHGPAFDQRKYVHLLHSLPDFAFYFGLNRLILSLLFHDIEEAQKALDITTKYRNSAIGSYAHSVFEFFRALHVCRQVLAKRRDAWTFVPSFTSILSKYKKWAQMVPQNFEHRYELLKAEKYRLQKSYLKSIQCYGNSIRAATAAESHLDIGLASEHLAGLFHELGQTNLASDNLKKALEAYEKWGAKRLVSRIKEIYRSWQLPEFAVQAEGVGEKSYDLAYLQKLLAEMTQDKGDAKLISRILSSTVHLSGADVGHFILKSFDDRTYKVKQSFRDGQLLPVDRPFTGVDVLCKSIIHYVIRTRRTVVVGDAQIPQKAIPGLERDPYVFERHIRSLACIPIEIGSGSERDLIALIYLENSMASHIFSSERLRLVELVGQAAAGRLEVSEKAHSLEESMKEAQLVQRALFPTIKHLGYFSVADYFKAADHTGGDWYGYYEEERKQRAYFFVGDVTGHGVSSALITGTAAGSVYGSMASLQAVEKDLNLVETTQIVATSVNRAVFETAAKVDKFMTMVFVSFDIRTGEVAFINAGHPHGFLISDYKVKALIGRGSPLGFHRDPHFKVQKLQLLPGDILFFYTDGLMENEGPEGDRLHPRELAKILECSKDPELIKKQLLSKSESIWQNKKAADDYAFVIIRWDGIKMEKMRAG